MAGNHRIIIWAPGAKGIRVSCSCGWNATAKTRDGAIAQKHRHEDETDYSNPCTARVYVQPAEME